MSVALSRDPLVGRTLGAFVLRERIGEGGFGAVYRATQPGLDREAVVKVLHHQFHASKAAAERFLREAKLASKLDHPYAAHIYEFGAEPDGELWIAMEFVRGTPLDQILKIQGPMSLERFLPLLDRVCEVVHTAHEQGIVHRDLKPANVMVLARAGRLLPKLLDFGIAKGLVPGATPTTSPPSDDTDDEASLRAALGSVERHAEALANTMDSQAGLEHTLEQTGRGSEQLELTQRGAIMGSPHYMAPEQWLDAGKVDARTDLYALAVVAYECLTGSPPFVGSTISQVAQAHARQAPSPVGPKLPAALDKVFAKALAKKSADRYPDVLAFIAAFRDAASVGTASTALPTLDPDRRAAALAGSPQPIAEAVAALDAGRNAFQAQRAVVQLARTIVRYIGLLAVACRSRVASTTESPAVADAMRTLYRRALSDGEWLELARQLTRAWLDRRDAYPVPELVDAFHGERAIDDELASLLALRERDTVDEVALLELLEGAMAIASRVLDKLSFLDDYALVVTIANGVAERWMGVRRTQRTTVAVSGKTLASGVPALVDETGTPVLVLSPLFQVAAPTVGAPLELFQFDGRDARGAKLVALPQGFEHHDDQLWDWFRGQLTGSLDDTDDARGEEHAPYRGLSAFGSDDGAMFFGREKQIDAFVNRLKLQSLLAVVGRSGAGKSSFVHAGVIPALGWRTIVMRPGNSPLASLFARLEHARVGVLDRETVARDRDALGALLRSDAARHGPVVVVVDQLEEMFTLCQDDDERRVFAEAVAAAARAPDDPVRVVFTLRDDFLVRTEQVPALRNRIGQGLQLLTVPGVEDLRRIVVEPARRAGYELEGDLADDMVKEVADQPGALALISFTAQKLWELRDRHFKQLTRAAYKTLGGVGGALAHHADVTLDAMRADERALARLAFRHLVTSQGTRAVLARADLRQLLGSSAHADAVIEALVAARLLVGSENEAGAQMIEIVHEALLVAWPRLAEWRREDAEGARFREQLRAAAGQWEERGRPKGLVWRGDALAEYTRWRARHPGPLTAVESAFAAASLADAARGRRNRRLLLASAFAVLVVVLVVLGISRSRIAAQKQQAERANETLHDNLQRQWENQGRLYLLANDPLKALAALAHAGELGASGWAHDFLIAQAVRATDGAERTLAHDSPVRSPEFSHDDSLIVTANLDGKVTLWDSTHGTQLRTLAHQGSVLRVAFSPDDRTLLSASIDGTARWWDVATGRELAKFDHAGKVVWCAMFSPRGDLALTAGDDDTVAIWELPSGTARLRVHGTGAGMHACALSPDGTRFAVADRSGTTRMWDTRTGVLVHELASPHALVGRVQFSPDGSRLVAASDDHTAVLWDVASGRQLHVLQHGDAVYWAELSPDGQHVVTASLDTTAAVWDVESGTRVATLAGHTSGVTRARYSPDGKHIVTASEDTTAQLWDAETGRSVALWRGHGGDVFDVSFDHGGRRVVTGSNDKAVIVWSVRPQDRSLQLRVVAGTTAARFSRDGTKVAVGNADGTTSVWDTSSGLRIAKLAAAGADEVKRLAFDPGGRQVAVAAADATVRVWDLGSPRAPVRELATANTTIESMAWSPDGTTIVTGTDDGYVRGWNVTSGKLELERIARDGVGVVWVEFHPDGRSLAVVTYGGVTQLWDRSGRELRRMRDADEPWSAVFDPSGSRLLGFTTKRTVKLVTLSGTEPPVQLSSSAEIDSAAWSPDGRIVVTSSLDGTAKLWDAGTGDQLAELTHVSRRASWVDFAPDGRILLAGDDGTTTIRELATYRASAAEFARLVRCRTPFEVRGDHLELRERDHAGCDGI